MIWFWLVLFTLVVGSIFYLWRITESKKYQDATYLSHLSKITLFFDTINGLDDYITWVHVEKIKSEFFDIDQFFNGKSNYYKKEESVKTFNDIYHNFDNYIFEYNKNYVISQKEQLSDFFDDIEGKKLDDQQRNALITDEYSNLIIAGAGSGKTLTIIGKIKYLLERKNVEPDNILLLSFTKKTVSELNERLINMGLGARATTFHKLGYDIIKNYQSSIPSVTNENTLRQVINHY